MKKNDILDCIDFLVSEKWNSNAKNSESKPEKRTSQKKLKKLTPANLSEIVDFLSKSNGKLDSLISKWLISGLLTGLRPCEWLDARISADENNTYMLVKNAKFNDVRGCGEYRKIHFKKGSEESTAIIIDFMSDLAALNITENNFSELYEKCRRRLYAVSMSLWPGRDSSLCLYTARHQFSANAKSELSLIEVAALMGHRSTRTATVAYLKKNHGKGGMIFIDADAQAMNRVEEKHTAV